MSSPPRQSGVGGEPLGNETWGGRLALACTGAGVPFLGGVPGSPRALRALATPLTSQFPEVPLETIQRAVAGEYDEYDNSALRDFVPILVERAVRAELCHRA